MKMTMPARLRTFTVLALAAMIALCLAWMASPPREPVWKGHRLSEWLDAHESNWRFDAGDGRHSKFRDEEIEEAIDGIGKAALPSLRCWITARPSRVKPWLNQWLNRMSWIQFRVGEDHDLQGLAETGFMVFGTEAQPLLPGLIQMSHSSDPDTRMIAYEAAFFTRPDREVFLPLAQRALKDKAAGCEAMAAQWMAERFPADAEKAGLRDRYPEYFRDASLPESVPANSP